MWIQILILSVCLLSSSAANARNTAQANQGSANTISPMMKVALELYQQKQWGQALLALQRELHNLRGRPMSDKISVYLYVGLILYREGHQGLAWKSFEQALFSDHQIILPAGESAETRNFFEKVRNRVYNQLGLPIEKIKDKTSEQPSTKHPISPPAHRAGSAWPWVVLSIAGASLTGGILLIANSASNNTAIEEFVKTGINTQFLHSQLEDTAQSMRDYNALQSALGGVFIGVGVLGIAGSVVLYILQNRQQTLPAQQPTPKELPSNALHSTPRLLFDVY
jgi:hypothetical protein